MIYLISGARFLLYHLASELDSREGIAAQKWDKVTSWCAELHLDCWKTLLRDETKLQWVECPGLLLTMFPFHGDHTHQRLLRVSNNLIIDDVRIDEDLIDFIEIGARLPFVFQLHNMTWHIHHIILSWVKPKMFSKIVARSQDCYLPCWLSNFIFPVKGLMRNDNLTVVEAKCFSNSFIIWSTRSLKLG